MSALFVSLRLTSTEWMFLLVSLSPFLLENDFKWVVVVVVVIRYPRSEERADTKERKAEFL